MNGVDVVGGEVGVGMAGEPFERPGERGRGGLVAGGEERDELVAELALGRAGVSEQVEDRVAAAGARRCARR